MLVRLISKLANMKNISTISSLLLIGTTFGFLMKGWLTPENFNINLPDEEVHLYL